MKAKKIIALLIAMVMMVSMFAACGKNDVPDTPKQDTTEATEKEDNNETQDKEDVKDEEDDESEDTEATEDTADNIIKSDVFKVAASDEEPTNNMDLKRANAAKTAIQFVQAAATNHFGEVAKMLNIKNTDLISVDNIKFALPRTDYAALADLEGKNVYVSVNKDLIGGDNENKTVVVDVMDESNNVLETFNMKLSLNANNEWAVTDNNFYEVNYRFYAPHSAKVSVNGVEVDKKFISAETFNKYYDLYEIPAIGKGTQKITVEGSIFKFEEDVITMSNNSDEEQYGHLNTHVTDEEEKKALDTLSKILNGMHKDFAEGKSATDLFNTYYAKNADPSNAQMAYNSMKAAVGQNVNSEFVSTVKKSDRDNLYIDKDTMLLRFEQDVSYMYKGNDQHTTQEKSSARLVVEDGEYKLDSIDPSFMDSYYWGT